MKKTIATAALTLALALPASASAAPYRECGDIANDGAYLVNVTTRVVSCSTARRALRLMWYGKSSGLRGYHCRNRQIGIESSDVRCTASGGRVIRYQTGA